MNRKPEPNDRPGLGGLGCGGWGLILGVLSILLLLSLDYGDDNGTGSGGTSTSGELSTSQDRRLDAALDDLARRCEESKAQLRRMINRAVEMKREEGVATDRLDIAEGLQIAIQGIRPGECVDELSGLLFLMDHQ